MLQNPTNLLRKLRVPNSIQDIFPLKTNLIYHCIKNAVPFFLKLQTPIHLNQLTTCRYQSTLQNNCENDSENLIYVDLPYITIEEYVKAINSKKRKRKKILKKFPQPRDLKTLKKSVRRSLTLNTLEIAIVECNECINKMPWIKFDLEMYNLAIQVYKENGEEDKAVYLHDEMVERGIEPDAQTWYLLGNLISVGTIR